MTTRPKPRISKMYNVHKTQKKMLKKTASKQTDN